MRALSAELASDSQLDRWAHDVAERHTNGKGQHHACGGMAQLSVSAGSREGGGAVQVHTYLPVKCQPNPTHCTEWGELACALEWV